VCLYRRPYRRLLTCSPKFTSLPPAVAVGRIQPIEARRRIGMAGKQILKQCRSIGVILICLSPGAARPAIRGDQLQT
jgi:hypothetical protein